MLWSNVTSPRPKNKLSDHFTPRFVEQSNKSLSYFQTTWWLMCYILTSNGYIIQGSYLSHDAMAPRWMLYSRPFSLRFSRQPAVCAGDKLCNFKPECVRMLKSGTLCCLARWVKRIIRKNFASVRFIAPRTAQPSSQFHLDLGNGIKMNRGKDGGRAFHALHIERHPINRDLTLSAHHGLHCKVLIWTFRCHFYQLGVVFVNFHLHHAISQWSWWWQKHLLPKGVIRVQHWQALSMTALP